MSLRNFVSPRASLCAALLLGATSAGGQVCPPAGAALRLVLETADGSSPVVGIAFGTLAASSCDGGGTLATGYTAQIDCDPARPVTCAIDFSALQPGNWTHRVLVVDGEATGQLQAREGLLLDASAGQQTVAWPVYRSVATVASLSDAPDCTGCLREALAMTATAPQPALIQFTPDLAGSIVLSSPLPPLAAGNVTIDAFDLQGKPHRREIDANGLNAAALKITSSNNAVLGLRITNVGAASDMVLIEGPSANDNLLDSLQVVGRALEICSEEDELGCVVDGSCLTPGVDFPRGACGDDGIAVRTDAGTAGVNVIRNTAVEGAFDKAIKVSNGAVARVERSWIHHNADGGLQATLGGWLEAMENLVEENRGTNSANGIAANGASPGSAQPAVLITRGNISRNNSLRGISVRSLSVATLEDDYLCGNGTPERERGFGLAVQDAAGLPATATVSGIAAVHNVAGGIVVSDESGGSFGTDGAAGNNAFAFNGTGMAATPSNFQNLTQRSIPAAGNQWERCGGQWRCDEPAVLTEDIFSPDPAADVLIEPAQATSRRRAPRIAAIEPPFAAAGDLVRIYGSGFDAIGGNGPGADCSSIAALNACPPAQGNCVMIDGQPAEVVAATPTMLVVKAPFTCAYPVSVAIRTRWSRGFGRGWFCVAPSGNEQ